MTRLAWRMLLQRPANAVAAFLALTFAVVIVASCGVLLESGIRYHGTTAEYAAAPVLVATTRLSITDDSGGDAYTEKYPLSVRSSLPAALPASIEQIPGVRAVITDTAVAASVAPAGPNAGAGRSAQVHPWSAAALAPYSLTAGRAPSAAGEVVVSTRLADELGAVPGERLELTVPGGPSAVRVVGVAAPGASSTPLAPAIFVSDALAAGLTGGAVQVIGVQPEPGVTVAQLATAVRQVVDSPTDRPDGAYPEVFTGTDRGTAESLDVGEARDFVVALAGSFGGCALLIALIVIAGCIGLSTRQRHRDIALLRAIAATPRQVRRLVVRETMVVAFLAAATGVWPGLLGARWLRTQFVDRGIVPDDFALHVSWLPPLVAAACAVLIAIAAAWIASLRPSRTRPSKALAESAVERRGIGLVRALLGLVALAGGIVLAVLSGSIAGESAAAISVGTVFALVTAVALLGPLVIGAATVLSAPLLRPLGVTGRLATATTGAAAARLSTVLTALVLAVGLGGSMWFVQTSQTHVAAAQSRAGVVADEVVVAPESGLSPTLTAALRRLGGVRAATGLVRTTWMTARSGGTDYTLQGVDPAGLGATLDLDVTEGSLQDLHGDTVAVDTLTAQELHLRLGSHLPGWYGDGAAGDPRVVAIYQRGLGFASLTMDRAQVAPHTSGLDDLVLVRLDASPAATAATLRRTITQLAPGATLVAASDYQAQLAQEVVESGWSQRVITAVLVLYAVIAAANALVMYGLGRRREYAVLRLAGTTRRQIRRMVTLEHVILLGATLVVGLAVAAATLLPMVRAITGTAAPYIPAAGWVSVIGGIVLLGGVAAALPLRRTLRGDPLTNMGIRE